MRAFRLTVLLVFAVAAPSTLAGQARVTGNIYLRLNSGDVQRGAAIEVSLLSLSAQRVTALRKVCQAQADAFTLERRGDSVQLAAATSPRERLSILEYQTKKLLANSRADLLERVEVLRAAKTNSDVNGAYAVTAPAPGRYYVHAIWKRSADETLWIVPVTVAGTVKVDLNNVTDAETGDPRINCEFTPPVVAAALPPLPPPPPSPRITGPDGRSWDTTTTNPRTTADSSYVGSIATGEVYLRACGTFLVFEGQRRFFASMVQATAAGYQYKACP